MLQRTRAVKRQARLGLYAEGFQGLVAQQFDQILCSRADLLGLVGVAWIMAQQVAVVLDEGSAATGRLDQAFSTAL